MTPDPLPGNEARVWFFPIPAEGARCDEWFVLLSPEERERATRFHFPADRARFVITRGRLRRLLSDYTGAPAGELVLAAGPHGKPALAGAELAFNVSHSGDYAVIALGRHPLGIDLERVRPLPDYTDLARRFFSPAEQEWLLAHPLPAQLPAFFRLWVIKEAWLKAGGSGLAAPLDRFTVTFPTAGPPVIEEQSGWRVHELELDPAYAAALVTAAAVVRLRVISPAA